MLFIWVFESQCCICSVYILIFWQVYINHHSCCYVLQHLCIPNTICLDINLYIFNVKQTTTFICKLNLLSDVCVMFVLFSRLCSVTYYEVVRVIQPGLKPQAGATPVLDLGLLHSLFKPNDKIFMPMTRDDIIHRLLYNRYE